MSVSVPGAGLWSRSAAVPLGAEFGLVSAVTVAGLAPFAAVVFAGGRSPYSSSLMSLAVPLIPFDSVLFSSFSSRLTAYRAVLIPSVYPDLPWPQLCTRGNSAVSSALALALISEKGRRP